MSDTERLDKAIDELANLCVDWRPARKKGFTPRKLRAEIVGQITEVMNQKGEDPPKWFPAVLKDVEELMGEELI